MAYSAFIVINVILYKIFELLWLALGFTDRYPTITENILSPQSANLLCIWLLLLFKIKGVNGYILGFYFGILTFFVSLCHYGLLINCNFVIGLAGFVLSIIVTGTLLGGERNRVRHGYRENEGLKRWMQKQEQPSDIDDTR